MKRMAQVGVTLWLAWAGLAAQAEEALSYRGDVGVGAYQISRVAGNDAKPTWFPYLYGDLGRWYARVDTFGYKAMPLGYGHVELSTRVSFEGYRPTQAALPRRDSPRLMGLGTFQETPWGGLFLYAFHDAASGGTMLDATYAAEFQWGAWTIYPELGWTRRSARYVQHLYGVSADQSTQTGLTPYAARVSSVPSAGWTLERPIGEHYKWVAEVKHRWLDGSITQSPLVLKKSQDSVLLSLARVY